jgi:hypothetical protein
MMIIPTIYIFVLLLIYTVCRTQFSSRNARNKISKRKPKHSEFRVPAHKFYSILVQNYYIKTNNTYHEPQYLTKCLATINT